MNPDRLYPRFARETLEVALSDWPVVLVQGPRQCGKSTLVQQVGQPLGYTYFTFDDPNLRQAAQVDPVGFVYHLPSRCILDEIQQAPQIVSSLKWVVDRDRQAGQFLLTGSANLLLAPQLSESLAGRMGIVQLYPLAQCELLAHRPHFLEDLLAGNPGRSAVPRPRLGSVLAQQIANGGFPAALARPTAPRRANWYRNYLDTLVLRDVRSLARIRSLDTLPRLLSLAASQTAQLFNLSDLAAPFELSRPTLRDYITLLEGLFLLELLPPWYSNHLSRLIKTPKIHLADTGLVCSLLGLNANQLWANRKVFGQLLETFVFQELRRQASWLPEPPTFSHFRDKEGIEVDIVLEQGGRLAAFEVKASATVTPADFRGLRKLHQALGDRFTAGVVLYDGEISLPFGERMWAVPFSLLWS